MRIPTEIKEIIDISKQIKIPKSNHPSKKWISQRILDSVENNKKFYRGMHILNIDIPKRLIKFYMEKGLRFNVTLEQDGLDIKIKCGEI